MQTTINSISEILGQSFENCQSPSLRLEKYVNFSSNNQGRREQEVAAVVLCHNKSAKMPKGYALSSLPGQEEIIACLKGNLIVNQSGGILENAGLCLNRLHGFPFIPGSAVKGVASLAAFREWEEKPTAELARQIAAVFGFPTGHPKLDQCLKDSDQSWQDRHLAGQVCFMPAIPFGDTQLTCDIETTHHQQYYQGNSPVAYDNEDPIPLPFPAVQGNVERKMEFCFRLMPLRKPLPETMANARKWLEAALTVFGVGAKIAAGYGWFTIGRDPVIQQEIQEMEQRELEKRQQAEEQHKREAAEEQRRQELANAQRELLAAEANRPFAELPGKNWKDFSHAVTDVFKKNGEQFSLERRQELLDVIANNTRLKDKDLRGGSKSLVKWLGEELKAQLFQRRGIDG